MSKPDYAELDAIPPAEIPARITAILDRSRLGAPNREGVALTGAEAATIAYLCSRLTPTPPMTTEHDTPLAPLFREKTRVARYWRQAAEDESCILIASRFCSYANACNHLENLVYHLLEENERLKGASG